MKLTDAITFPLALKKYLASLTRNNHYVPIWYQKGFFFPGNPVCLDLYPDKKILPSGKIITSKNPRSWVPKKCFVKRDLYTTAPRGFPNDEIERYLFGIIDGKGSSALRALLSWDFGQFHRHFQDFFEYMDAQKIRTPKIGLALWPEHGESYESVLNAANKAEHEAKRMGKNRVVVAKTDQDN